MQSWIQALRREGIHVAEEGAGHRGRAIVQVFRDLGGHDCARLHRLTLWLAPSLYTVRQEPADAGAFTGTETLDREYVSFSAAVVEQNSAISQIEEYASDEERGGSDKGRGRPAHTSIGTVNQGRWCLLAIE